MVIFDIKTKTSDSGIIKEVLGNNTYLVLVKDKMKHVSGDCITMNREITHNDNKVDQESDLQDLSLDNVHPLLDDDNHSIASESSVGDSSSVINHQPYANIRGRRGRNRLMVRRLVTPPPPRQNQGRLRSRH